MSRARTNSRGTNLADRLKSGRQKADRALRPGGRQLPVLRGVTPGSNFVPSLENVLVEAREILIADGTIFVYGDSIVTEFSRRTVKRLATLATGHQVDAVASSLLVNKFLCENQPQGDKEIIQFSPPPDFVRLLLNSEPTREALPEIKHYATRPVFDRQFQLKGPGWHPDAGLLVHSPDIDVILPENLPTDGPAKERLPPRLRSLLADFSFRSCADVANTVGAMLTGMLMPHFVESGKPVCLLDANQPGAGKTLLAQVMGQVLDGQTLRLTQYSTDDEEMGKRLCATLRGVRQSLVLIDNAKVKTGESISGSALEASITAQIISMRILGKSENFEIPNDLLWLITMNSTQASPDIVSRSLPIRFLVEGNPARRDFGHRDPISYAQVHRLEILGELAGMVVRWVQAGRPNGNRPHRFTLWAQIIGGILETNHLTEFLENVEEAAAEFNATGNELADLAVVAVEYDGFFRDVTNLDAVGDGEPNLQGQARFGRVAGDWVNVLRRAGVLVDEMDSSKSPRAKATRAGNYLRAHLSDEVSIEYRERTGAARLCVDTARARQSLYYFEVRWHSPAAGDDGGAETHAPSLDRSSAPRPGSWATTDPDTHLAATPPARATPAATSQTFASTPGNQEAW